jgi:8-oxo-dGTP pyrophosphatase MutT (NUDIX family)
MSDRTPRDGMVHEAGAVAVRLDRGEPRYLLVTAKVDATQWIFPKGHIEPGETPVDAARRELREEAGVEARARGEVGRLRFRADTEDLEVTYFLLELVAERASPEGRGKAWLPFADAAHRISFDDARALLARARQMIEEAP